MDPQTKLENVYDQNTFKFHKILILAPYVSTGARPVTECVENEPQNDIIKKKLKSHKLSRMILDKSKEVHVAFLATRAPLKRS